MIDFICSSAVGGEEDVLLFAKLLLVFSLLLILFRSPSLSNPSVPSIGPGTIPQTLMPLGPHSVASTLVIASTPALAAEEWTYPQDPFQWRVALILIITPLFLCFMLPLKTDWLMLKVPRVSISRTFLTPFVEIFSALAKKLPAAPFTRTSICPNYWTTALTTS